MMERLIVAGAGGQGVMFAGKAIAKAAIRENNEVTWFPSYGPEMRGGTANCSVVISNEEIGNPAVADADTLICLNQPSMDRFSSAVKPGGLILANSSLVTEIPESVRDITVSIPAQELAAEAGSDLFASVVMVGVYTQTRAAIKQESVAEVLRATIPAKREQLLAQNLTALRLGAGYTEGS